MRQWGPCRFVSAMCVKYPHVKLKIREHRKSLITPKVKVWKSKQCASDLSWKFVINRVVNFKKRNYGVRQLSQSNTGNSSIYWLGKTLEMSGVGLSVNPKSISPKCTAPLRSRSPHLMQYKYSAFRRSVSCVLAHVDGRAAPEVCVGIGHTGVKPPGPRSS